MRVSTPWQPSSPHSLPRISRLAGKHHEWLYALKLQAEAHPNDKPLRTEITEALTEIHQKDPRLKTILAIAELDQNRTPLPKALARIDTLLALQPAAFCQHKSWGFGRVKNFDTTLGQVVLAFGHNPAHSMQLAYAADSLTPISQEHIEVRKMTDLDGLKRLSTEDPAALLRQVLLSHNRSATADRIESMLSGSVIPADQWKKWWENVRKLAKKDPHIDLPIKKTEPIVLRTAPVSQQDEILDSFRSAKGLVQKTAVAKDFLKRVDDMDNADLLVQEFQDALLDALQKTPISRQPERIEAAVVLEQLGRHRQTATEDGGAFLINLLSGIYNLSALLDDLSSSAAKRVLAVLKASAPDRLFQEFNRFSTKVLDEIPDLLGQNAAAIKQWVHNQTAGSELLCWIARNVSTPSSRKACPWLEDFQTPALLLAVVEAIESAPTKSANKKLRDVLFEEGELVADLLAEADPETVRKLTRLIMSSSAIEELDRRSLMARIVKEHPFVQEFLISKTVKEQPLIVSWGSYRKRQAELEDIVKKIPQNSKEIGLARSYGDLRENFEFKAAKDMQKLLMRRRAELENLLSRAQATDFADVKTDLVSIGSSVTVTDIGAKQTQTYHILGAWDSDPTNGVISYPAALAQALLNKHVGDTIDWQGDAGPLKFRIDRIEKVPSEILTAL